MNERIRELALQADKLASAENRHYGLMELSEKFAELIVRECINCCDEVDRINKAYIEKLQFDPKNGPKECIQVIKEHFGVEA